MMTCQDMGDVASNMIGLHIVEIALCFDWSVGLP